ncbi:class I SAM-dependent methyltransferase [Rhizobium lusitanum]|uniref:Class I SAM-dependent methyltransferase n=1 Tax=Rhizobium lusitanum TaxID=293958 RepID=A0A6L9UFR0_9HYPH|nr:class I SAM-dependent methyltransferase [Rhizobium lusitanum]NEI74873.1 class I SAM-dependent methyltransferase [Rhizobium lusitanum]
MKDFSKFLEECEGAPRLNELSGFFAATAGGRSGRPIKQPQVDRRLMGEDELLDRFVSLHEQRRGPFDQHYHSSIPYRLEEECRLGHAILQYSQAISGTLNLYSLGTAEGTMARTVSELANGRVESLSCSPNVENQDSFLAHGDPPHATFFLGPFHHLTRDLIQSRPDLAKFASGFDIIFEDTTFQMYSPNRFDQIRFVSQHLKSDGLFIFVEKFRHDNDEEYFRRERQKDSGFKARFFSPSDIRAKQEAVLNRMNQNEVTLTEIARTMRRHFSHTFVTWNSGNFYTLISSNSADNLCLFSSKLSPAAIPGEYVYADLPYRLYPESYDVT